MAKLFDRSFVSRQHARRSPLSPDHDFLFRHIEDDALARLSFLKTPPKIAAIQGRRPSATLADRFPQVTRFKLHEDSEDYLPFDDNAAAPFDLILTLLSLHAANDVPHVLSWMKSALSEQGLMLACVFGPRTLSTLRQALAAAENELRGAAGPRVYPFAEAPAWAGLMQQAGFALPVADAEIVTVHYKSLNALLKDIRMMGEANGLAARPRSPLSPPIVERAEEIYRELAPSEDGLLPAEFEIVWFQGFKN